MPKNRDEFSIKVRRALQERVGNCCSNPGCRKSTSGPNTASEKSTNIGVAAHIKAAAPGGPRFDPDMTPEERKSIDNGIWLCSNCARLVDSDEKQYPVNLLQEWKENAEHFMRKELEGKSSKEPALVSESDQEGLNCTWCGTFVKYNSHICLGCNAELVVGATRIERKQSSKVGIVLGFCMVFILMIGFPEMLNSLFSSQIPPFFGLGSIAILIMVILIVLGS